MTPLLARLWKILMGDYDPPHPSLWALALLLLSGCSAWRMSADRERDCNDAPYHLWRDGECRRVR